MDALDIGGRLELFVDEYLIESLAGGAAQRLHAPMPAETAVVFDRPWEGGGCNYVTVFRDGMVYRLYYRGCHGGPEVTCYAESSDGIHWQRPDLGIYEVNGTRRNNVVLTSDLGGDLGLEHGATHNFSPFCDARPDVPTGERYKALGGGCRKWGGRDLIAFASPDGLHWRRLRDEAVITQGMFDSQNVAFWDVERKQYRAYVRDFRQGRDIRTCTSPDFLNWTDAEFLDYAPGRTSQLYTNQVQPYYRAPHIFLGFPTRYVERPWLAATDYLPGLKRRRECARRSLRQGSAVTDGMFMASRDGRAFRIWPESFIRPGLRDRDGWFYGDNYQALGLVETASRIEGAPRELSLFVTEGAQQEGPARLRRCTIRVDGFVSINAPLSGGELVTRPLQFKGAKLLVNYATGAAGSLRVEIQEADGAPLPGYGLAEAQEMFGDSLEQPVLWQRGADVSALAGQAVRLRFVLADADLYSFRFGH